MLRYLHWASGCAECFVASSPMAILGGRHCCCPCLIDGTWLRWLAQAPTTGQPNGRAGPLNSGLTSKPKSLGTHCLPSFFKAFFVLDREGRVGHSLLNVYWGVPALYILSMNVDKNHGPKARWDLPTSLLCHWPTSSTRALWEVTELIWDAPAVPIS